MDYGFWWTASCVTLAIAILYDIGHCYKKYVYFLYFYFYVCIFLRLFPHEGLSGKLKGPV